MIFGTIAQASFAQGAPDKGIVAFKSMLGGKSLQCVPTNHAPPYSPAHRGDNGYFTVSVNSKNQIEVTDAGDRGYGFSNGNFTDIATVGKKAFLTVGDDGNQTLAIDFDRMGAFTENCANAVVNDYSNFDYTGSIPVTCCLK